MAPLTSIFIRLTNHDPRKAHADGCDNYLAVLGFLLIAIPAVTTYGMFSTLHYAADMPDHLVIPITITTWVMTSALEYWIVSSRRENDKVLTPKLVLRLLFTLVTTSLVMFGVLASLTDHEVASKTTTAAQSKGRVAQKTAEAPLQAVITADNASIKSLQAAIDKIPSQRATLYNAWRATWLTPCPGSQRYTCEGKDIRHGPGSHTSLTALHAFNTQAATVLPQDQSEITRLSTEVATETPKRDAAGEAAYRNAAAGVGIGSKSSAMWQEFKVTPVLWILAAMVALWDCLALAVKMSMPTTVFDYEHQARKKQQRANAAGMSQSQADRIASATRVEAARILTDEAITLAAIAEDETTGLARAARDGQALRDHEAAAGPTHTAEPTRPDRTASPEKADGRSFGQRLTVVGMIAALALTGGGLITWNVAHSSGSHPATIKTSPATTTPAKPIQVAASFAAYAIPHPSAAQATAAREYLTGSGRPILALHQASKATVTNYTPAACTRMKKSITNMASSLAASALAPDQTIKDLALDELHDVATLPACPASPPATLHHLAGIDSLLAQRLSQDGVPA